MKKEILGVRIDDISMDDAILRIEHWIWNPGKYYIVTPNPEFIVAAQKNPEFKKILNKANMATPDGVGLKLARFARHACDIESTISGVDLMERLIMLSAEKGFAVAFLGGSDKVAKKTSECLQKKYKNLKIVFAESGGEIDNEGVMKENVKIPPCDILFVAFGHIKQEKWIAKNLPKIPVKLAMGVGGAFDYTSGMVPRAPEWLRNLGFEWLFRLVIQPWRIKRQFALLKYLWLLVQ